MIYNIRLSEQIVVADPVIIDSVTQLGPEASGATVVAGSHCGVFSARLAVVKGCTAVFLNDAGVGKNDAGIGGLDFLQSYGIPAAAVRHDTARIGDGQDAFARGVIGHLNEAASSLGLAAGMKVSDCVLLIAGIGLEENPMEPDRRVVEPVETRCLVRRSVDVRPVVVVDSISLVEPQDAGAIVVSGSHGGLLGGRPQTAIRVDAFAAIYNDACGGIDGAGFTRLPELDRRGIAAATVDAFSAEIGNGLSTFEEGLLSRVNSVAARFGGRVGMPLRAFVECLEQIQARGEPA